MHTLRSFGRRAAPLGLALGITTAAVLVAASPAYAAATTLDNPVGPSGGGNVLSVADTDINSATVGNFTVQFQYAVGTGAATDCLPKVDATHAPTDAPIAASGSTQTAGILTVADANVTATNATGLKIIVPPELALAGSQISAEYNVCVYDEATNFDLIVDTGTNYRIVPRLTLPTSQEKGPSGGGNTLTLSTVTPNGLPLGSAVGAQFQQANDAAAASSANPVNTCSATWLATSATVIPAANVGVLTGTKVAVTVPAGVSTATAGANWHVCIYEEMGGAGAGTSNDLIAAAATASTGTPDPYFIATTATITSVTPTAGPAQGGTVITVEGTLFPTTPGQLTATLGGSALGSINVLSATKFTAVTPARAAGGPLNLVVTTQGGPTTRTGAFTYTNGIVVTPNTAPNTRWTRTWTDLRGIGFGDLTPTTPTSTTNGSNPNGPGAHVYLVDGKYNPVAKAGVPSGKEAGQVTECTDVIIIDDTELVCSLFLGGALNPAPVRTLTGCTTANAAATLTGTNAAGTCSITATDLGMGVNGANIPAGTYISAVGTPSTATATASATLSQNATGTNTSLGLVNKRTQAVTIAAATSGNATLAPTGTFKFATGDVGKAITGLDSYIPPGAVIASVDATSGVATLSVPPLQTGTPQNVVVVLANIVPVGTYTITVVNNGSIGAAIATLTQSIISSGSTFTVSDY